MRNSILTFQTNGGGSGNFKPSFGSGSVRFVPKGRGGPCVFIHHISKCSGPPHPIHFDRSLKSEKARLVCFAVFTQKRIPRVVLLWDLVLSVHQHAFPETNVVKSTLRHVCACIRRTAKDTAMSTFSVSSMLCKRELETERFTRTR